MIKTLKDYKNWIDTYENPTESEQELIDGFKDILDEIFVNHQKALDEKDKNFVLKETVLKTTIFELQRIQLKKSDFEYYYDCEYCGRLSEGQECEKAYYDNECFRYHDETHILIALKAKTQYENLEE